MEKKDTMTKTAKTREENDIETTKRELTEDEKACITNYQERPKRKPLKFENTKNKDGNQCLSKRYRNLCHLSGDFCRSS
jgi:hypothetical protein